VGVVVPGTVFGNINANRTMQEMVNLANEMAQRIAYDTHDWTRLKTDTAYVGDGVKTAWEIPFNFKRLMPTSNVWSEVSVHTPMAFIHDTDEWLRRRTAGETDSRGEWTMLGDYLHIYPALSLGLTARYNYLDKDCVRLGSGGNGDRFLTDDDSFRLDERLLKLALIYQWKAHKGSPYAEDMGTYSDAIQTAIRFDNPAPIIIDRLPASRWTRDAHYQ
jgi:hypothetical protein